MKKEMIERVGDGRSSNSKGSLFQSPDSNFFFFFFRLRGLGQKTQNLKSSSCWHLLKLGAEHYQLWKISSGRHRPLRGSFFEVNAFMISSISVPHPYPCQAASDQMGTVANLKK